jgi:DNA-binding NarL/FixJ family response regulator
MLTPQTSQGIADGTVCYIYGRSVESRAPMTEPPLSREPEIVRLVVEAEPNKIIAYRTGLTEGTVKVYLHRIFRRHGCRNRTELAIKFAYLRGPQ